jgi:DNA-binding NarL/FixJ family response regulator
LHTRTEKEGETITFSREFARQFVQILIVEDFEPYRAYVTSLLNENAGLRIVCEAGDGLQGVEKAQELRPDLILMDVGLPGLNGIEAARQILNVIPEAKIIFLTQETSVDIVHEALNVGARGYVVKARAGSELLEAIDAALKGRRFVSSGLDGQGTPGADR